MKVLIKRKLLNFCKNIKGDEENYLFLPLVGKNNDLALVINKSTGLPVDGITIDPW